MDQQCCELIQDNSVKFHNPFDWMDASNHLSLLKVMIFDTPTAVHAKINLIKNEIAEGQYRINSQNIATKLLDCVLTRLHA